MKDYFFIYLYQHCPQVHEIFTESTLNIAVRDAYTRALSDRRRQLGRDVVRFLQKQRFDSLALVFPTHKKFAAALKKASSLVKDRAVTTNVFAGIDSHRPTETIVLHFSKKNKGLGELRLTAHNRLFKKGITAAVYRPAPKDSEVIMEDQIIEIGAGNE